MTSPKGWNVLYGSYQYIQLQVITLLGFDATSGVVGRTGVGAKA
jgi:hypothetical protein